MSAPASGPDQPQNEWLSLQPPIWILRLWGVVLAVSTVAFVVSDDVTSCTLFARCEAGESYVVVLVLAAISAVTISWAPVIGLTAGTAYGLVAFIVNPGSMTRYAGAGAGAIAFVLLVSIQAFRALQAKVAAGDSTALRPGDLLDRGRESVVRMEVGAYATANFFVGEGASPVATVRLTQVVAQTEARRVTSAQVRGRVADGSWVRIETEIGPLRTSGPIRAERRWRPMRPPEPGSRADRWSRRARRARTLGWQLVLIAIGCVMIVTAADQATSAWAAARGQGVAGTVIITHESCGGKGGCTRYGEFRSTDGRYVFEHVQLVGARGLVGSSAPAAYVGDDPTPSRVYGRGWGGVAESGFYALVGLLLIAVPVVKLLGWSGVRSLGRGRHGARGRQR